MYSKVTGFQAQHFPKTPIINHNKKNLKIVLGIPFENSEDFLMQGLRNLSPVRSGQVIGFRQSKTEIIVPFDSFTLFPKYPERNEKGQCLTKLPNFIVELAVDV